VFIATIAASCPAHAAFDIMGSGFNDNDGVVDHDPDRQYQGEQRGHIDAEAERPHHREGADDGDWHRGRRNQHGAPILQEDGDDDSSTAASKSVL
jgi:hypothetical protein